MPEPGHNRRELAATAAVDAVPDEVKKEVVLRALREMNPETKNDVVRELQLLPAQERAAC